MSEILSRTVFETCLADQSEAPWEEEVRMLLAHDAALRAEVERLRKALRESQETLALVLWAHTRGRVTVFDHHRVTLPIPWEIVTYLDVDTRATVIGARAAIAAEEGK